MKQILMIALILITNTSLSFADNTDTNKYEALSTWTGQAATYPVYDFSQLEQLGVERDAEKNAIAKCVEATNAFCYSISVSIIKCNQQEPTGAYGFNVVCRAKAVAVAR
jgi:hypothetical protein